jgi:hypothetical protein
MTKDEALVKLELVTNRLITAEPLDDRSDPEWTALVEAVRILRDVVEELVLEVSAD